LETLQALILAAWDLLMAELLAETQIFYPAVLEAKEEAAESEATLT